MAEMNPQNPQAGLEKPAGSAPAAAEPVIHVIPDKFYGAALKKKVALVEPPKPAVPAKPTAPQPPRPPVAAKPKGKGGLIALILIILILGGGGAGAYFFLFAKKPATPVTNTAVNAAPAGPVCGNAACEAGETYVNCPQDCPKPKPVCGDKKCDSPEETPQNCPDDCGPPPPVCGDNKCDKTETYQSCPQDCQPPTPVPAKDSDSDGLTDVEETTIYGTDPFKADSSGRGYLDGNQVLYLYDPASSKNAAQLKDNPGIATYANAAQGYTMLYPRSWSTREGGENASEAYFTAPTGEFVEVLVQDNPDSKPLMDWYLEQSPGVKSSEVQLFKTKQGYDEILSPDRFTAFVAVGKKVFVVSYNLSDQVEIRFRTTFSMMVTSLAVTQK